MRDFKHWKDVCKRHNVSRELSEVTKKKRRGRAEGRETEERERERKSKERFYYEIVVDEGF